MQDSIVNLNTDSEEFIETNQKLIAAQEQYTSVSRAKVEVINAEDDSIVGLQKQYKKMYNDWKLMSEAERNNNQQMAADMAALSDKINNLKKDVGSYKDNIGRYSESIIDAFSKMGISMGALQAPMVAFTKIFEDGGKGIIGSINTITDNINKLGDGIKQSMSESSKATAEGISQIGSKIDGLQGIAANGVGAIKKLGTALRSFISIPAVATIAAIVLAFKGLQAIAQRVKEAINQNEESQMALKVAMSQFQPVIDAVSNAFDKLGTIVVKVIGFLGDAFSKIREVGAGITDFLGITKGAQDRVKEQNKLYKETAKAENELVKTKREYLKLNADDTAEVERLREEASETTNLEEKKKLLTEAKEKQAEIDARNIEVAKAELAIIQEQASRTANDAEMNDKLAAALAKVSQAEAEAAKNARNFNKQLNGGGEGGGGALKNWREEAKKIYEETLENSKTEITKLTEKYEKEKKLLVKYHYDTTLLTKKYNEEITKIRKEEAQKQLDERAKVYERRRNALQEEWESDRKKGPEGELIAIAKEAELYEKKITPTLKSLDEKVYNFLRSFIDKEQLELGNWDAAFAPMKEMEDLINDKGFEALPDEYKEIKDAVAEVNAEFGLQIDSVKGVKMAHKDANDTLDELDQKYAHLAAEIEGNKVFKKIEGLATGMSLGMYEIVSAALKNGDGSEEMWKNIDNFTMYYQRTMLEAQKAAYEQELANFKGTQDQKLELLQQYYDTCEALREQDEQLAQTHSERNKAIWEASIGLFGDINSSVNSISSSYSSLIDSEVALGRITEAQGKKRKKVLIELEKVALIANIAQIAASTASGIMDVWKAYGTETASNAVAGFGNPYVIAALNAKSLAAAIIKTTAIGTAGAANIAAATMGSIAKINNMKADIEGADAGGGGTSAVANVQEIDSTPYTYTRTIQTQEEYDDLNNRQMWVSVSDIESGLNQRVKVVDESSF